MDSVLKSVRLLEDEAAFHYELIPKMEKIKYLEAVSSFVEVRCPPF